MSSPMVEIVREIPLLIDRDFPMESEETGFPFDDDREEQEEAPFRSQLDDIAARHPEFAQHLGSFPFRSGARTRTPIPEEFTNQRFTERPFGDRFERFGFPFDEPFREEEHKPYYQRYPKYYPTQKSQEETAEQGCSNQESPSANSKANNEDHQEEQERGRRPKQFIQQSNTVDLGQRQEPVDDRTQRSMSAPPPNNRPRFVSSINIPVNQPSEKANVAHDTPQTSAPSQPQERVIPIHVEGRDEPVIPKRFASQSASQPQAQPQPCTDKFFTQRSPNFSQYFNREQPFQNEWFPRGFHGKQSQPQANYSQGQRGRSPQPQPKPEQHANVQKQSEPQQKPQQQSKADPEETIQQEPPRPQVSSKPDPIDQIKSIQKDVSELMGQVDQFRGKPRDKQYIFLDEMLTRNLIKLDNIDTQGQENIRLARKEAIKCIEKCISILESKANANVEYQAGEEGKMDVENSEGSEAPESKKMEVENTADVAKKEEAVEVQTDEAKPSVGESMELEAATMEKAEKPEGEAMDAATVSSEGDKPGDENKQQNPNEAADQNKSINEGTEEEKDSTKNDETHTENQETKEDSKKEKKKIKKKTEKK